MIINVKHVHNLNKVHICYCLIQIGVIGYTCKMSHFDTAAMRGQLVQVFQFSLYDYDF